MPGVLALFAAFAALAQPATALDPARLPELPARGLARDTAAGVELQTMRGRSLGVIPRLDLAPDKAMSSELLLRDRGGSLFAIDFAARRVRRVLERPAPLVGCRLTDTRPGLQLLACKSTIKTRTAVGQVLVVARPPGKIGHWERAAFAPRGNVFFAQWSAECEVPVGYVFVGGKRRDVGVRNLGNPQPSSVLGWLAADTMVVHYPTSGCGSAAKAGVYSVTLQGKRRLLVPTPRFAYYWMWGG